MSCLKLNDEHWIAAPTIMIVLPTMIVRFRPRKLPSHMVATAPKKQPSVYAPTVIPWTLEALLALPPGGFCVSI